MTRGEALEAVRYRRPFAEVYLNEEWFVDALVAFGLLHLDATSDKDRIAAAERLQGCFMIPMSKEGLELNPVRISKGGAYEILDVLTKSGFKITRET